MMIEWKMHDGSCGLEHTGFNVGDIVELASGGPDMVVISVCPNGCVECAWGVDDDVRIDVFPKEALVDV